MNLLQKDTHELSKLVDDIGITHIRMQQTVKGYPVWGGDYIIHLPKNGNKNKNMPAMNGIVYKEIEADLVNTFIKSI